VLSFNEFHSEPVARSKDMIYLKLVFLFFLALSGCTVDTAAELQNLKLNLKDYEKLRIFIEQKYVESF